MNIWIYHNFNGDYYFLFMALIIPNWKLYLMFYTFLEHNNYFLMALWFSLHGIALDCCEDVLFVLFSVITQWQWWRELMTVINLWQHSSAAIFFSCKSNMFFALTLIFRFLFSLWPQWVFFFLTSISRFLFYDLYVLIAIGFHFYDLYVLSHCHRVPFFWPLFQGSQYHWSRAWKMFWLISLPMVLLLGMIF